MRINKGDTVVHFKGKKYKILNIAKDSENLELHVVYQSLSDPDDVWIRPLQDFFSEVDKQKYPDITQLYRFEKNQRLTAFFSMVFKHIFGHSLFVNICLYGVKYL